jgi:hypothetical protein
LSVAPQNPDGGFRKPAIHYADTGKIVFYASCNDVEFMPIKGYATISLFQNGERQNGDQTL